MPGTESHQFSEVIGGQSADLFRNRSGQRYYTGAEWDAIKVWLDGEASDVSVADLQLAMYRTVIFGAP